jgi:hypothetical protein
MSHSRKFGPVLVILNLSLILLLLCGTAQAANTLTLSVPASAVPGGEVEISGSLSGDGVAGVSVGIILKDSAAAVFFADETKTDASGSFNISFTLPGNASHGDWQVQAAGGGATAGKTFSVGGTVADKVSVNVSSASVKPGGAVIFSGKVPQDNVPVGITVKDPNGGVAFVEQTTAGADGGYTFQFDVPAGAPTGIWTADVAGGGTTGQAAFTVSSGGGGGSGSSGGGGGGVISTCKQPAVAGYLPQAGAAGVALDAEVSVIFDIAVDKVSSTSLGGIVIRDESGNRVGGVTAALSGKKLTISHADFINNTKYTVIIPENALVCGGSSNSGYYNKGISWSFTTLNKPEAPAAADQKSGYSDVPPSHWAFNDITALGVQRIIKGYPDGTFRPDNNITRAEFAVVLAKALGWPAKPGGHDFADAAEIPDWARGCIFAAVDKGVISGYEDNTFRANRPVTRSEIAVIVVRALGLAPEAGALIFSDAAEIPDWAKGYIAAAVNQGVIAGKPGNIFAPDDNATRAEAAALVARMLDKI